MHSFSPKPLKKAPQNRGMSAALRRLAARRMAMTGACAILSAGALLSQQANATPYYWSVGGVSPAAGGTGVWDLSTQNWLSGSATGPVSLYGNGASDGAIFGGTAGTVTLGTGLTINANFLTFLTTAYVISTNPTLGTFALGAGANNAALNLSGTNPVIDTGTFSETINGFVNGSGFAKNGSGTLTMTAATATIGGTTTASSNTVTVTGGDTSGILPGMPVVGDGIPTGDTVATVGVTPGTFTLTNALGTSGAATGTLTFASVNTFTGGSVVVNAGSLTTGAITGSSSLTKNGTGTLTLNGVNTYTGGTTINNGTVNVRLDNANISASTGGGTFAVLQRTVNVGGGTINTTGGAGTGTTAFIDTVSALNVTAGATSFTQARGGSARVISGFNAITRAVGGTVSFTDPINANGTNNANTGGYRLNNAANVNGVVPYVTYTTNSTTTSWFAAFVNASNASNNGTNNNGSAYSAFTASSTSSLGTAATQNVDVTTDVGVPSGGATVNTLRFNNATARTVTIGGSDIVTVAAGGILMTPLSGGATITGGTLEGGNPGSGSGQDLIIIDNPTTTASASLFTIGSTIADNTTATALTKSGIGTLVLTNTANTYTGNTYLNGGVTQIAAGTSLGSTAATLVFSGGTLQLSSTPTFSGGLVRPITLNDAGGTIDTNGNSITYSGVMAPGTGLGGFTKAGTGVLTFSNTNTYIGTTTVSAGNLALGASGSTGSGAVNVSSGAVLSGAGTAGGTVTVGAGSILAPGINTNPSGTFGAAGTLTVGSLNLSSATSTLDFDLISGSTTATSSQNDKVIVQGPLTITGGQFNLSGTGATTGGGVVYDLFGYGSLTNTFVPGAFSVASGGIGGLTYTFGNDAVNKFITLTITGNAAPIFTWNVDANGNWSNAANWNPNTGIPHNPGDEAIFGSAILAPRTVTLDGSESVGILIFNNANAYTIAPGAGSLIIDNGAGTTNITDTNGSHFITAPVTLNSSTIATVTNGGDTLTISGNINGAGGLSKSGPGILALSGNNSYGPAAGTVGTTLSTGTLQVGSNTALGAGDLSAATATLQSNAAGLTLANNMVISNGATETVDTNGNTLTLTGVLSDITSGGSLTKIGLGTLALTNADTFAGPTTITAGTLQLGAGGALGSLSGNIVDNATLAFLDNNADTPTVANTISGTGVLAQNGTDNVTLTGTNTFTGITNINAGTLTLSAPGAGTTSLALQNSTLNYGSGTLAFGPNITAVTLGGLTGAVAVQNIVLANSNAAPAPVTLTVADVAANSYSGILSGSGSLVKTGAGTLTLGGANTYAGTTTLGAGGLTLTGSIGTQGVPSGAASISANAGVLSVSGGSLNVASLSIVTPSTGLTLTNNGTIAITGALALNSANASSGTLASLTSGTFSAGNVALNRGNNNYGSALLTAAPAGTATDGFYVNGANATIGTTLQIGSTANNNASTSARIDNGSLTVNGITSIADNTTARDSLLVVTGGTFTDNDTTGVGIQIGSTFAVSYAQMLVTGGTVNTNAITLGNSLQTGGNDFLVIEGGTTNIGLGGVALGGGTGGTVTVDLGTSTVATAPTISTLTSWSSPVPMTLANSNTNTAVTIQPTASNSITLTGLLSGSGGINKTGTGTLVLGGTQALPGTVANTYGGGTTITAGTVAVSSNLAAASGSALGTGTVTFSGGTLQNVNLGGSSTNNVQTTGMASLATGTSSVLDFGATNTGAVFSFTSFDTTNTGFLTIKNWTGSPTGGGADQLYFGTTPQYSDAQLSNVVFNNGTSNVGATQLTSGEIVPNGVAAAPEPSQWVAFGLGIFGLGGLTLRARRRAAKSASIA